MKQIKSNMYPTIDTGRFRPVADSRARVQDDAMSAKAKALAALLLALPNPGIAQLDGPRTKAGCIGIAGSHSVTAEGRLTLQSFAGPPNYESIAAGDAEERAFILELPRSACMDDGGGFADPSERFATVHVSARDDRSMAVLRASIGRQVRVSGEAMAAHAGHHHAPLVVLADTIAVR